MTVSNRYIKAIDKYKRPGGKYIVAIPFDPFDSYIKLGYTEEFLERYYNPNLFFDKVFILSPFEKRGIHRFANMVVIGDKPRNFIKWIRAIKPIFVRGYGGIGCSTWVCLNKVWGIPTIVSVHDTADNMINDDVELADSIICVSQACKDAVIRHSPKVDKSKIHVLPNKINTRVFKPSDSQEDFDRLNNKYPGKYHLLHVGRKTEQKNIENVIKALKILGNDYTAVFVGRGDNTKYREIAHQMGVANQCYWEESVPNDKLPVYYSWCDCMCTPSRWEGFGIVFAEAAASGGLIITSDIAPMNEFLKDNESALLVKDYENPEEIAKKVSFACDEQNHSVIKVIRENAIIIGESFDYERISFEEINIEESANSNNSLWWLIKFRRFIWLLSTVIKKLK